MLPSTTTTAASTSSTSTSSTAPKTTSTSTSCRTIIFLLLLVVLSFNLLLLVQTTATTQQQHGAGASLQQQQQQHYVRIGSDFFSSFTPVEETVSHTTDRLPSSSSSSSTSRIKAAAAAAAAARRRRAAGSAEVANSNSNNAAASDVSAAAVAASAAATGVVVPNVPAVGAAHALDIDSTTTTTTTTTKARVAVTANTANNANNGEAAVATTKSSPLTTATQQPQSQSHSSMIQPSKVLMGVFSSDTYNDASYRARHRTLFKDVWGNDPRLCSLEEFRTNKRRSSSRGGSSNSSSSQKGGEADNDNISDNNVQRDCRVIYTFIMGGNYEDGAPTMRLESTDDEPLVLEKMRGKSKPSRDDIYEEHDVTLLNIKENMNDGKSPTFLAFAQEIMNEFDNVAGSSEGSDSPVPSYHIDYAMKLDADAILHYHDFLMFVDQHLPPAPYNTNVFVGALRDKAGWPKDIHPQSDMARLESFWGNEFEGVHLYLAGQTYILSRDLCQFVVDEAPFADKRIGPGGYLEGHEDHDVSSMAWHSPTPLHLITIGKSQRFWEHPVKGQPRWIRIEKRERARVEQKLFEGKKLRLY